MTETSKGATTAAAVTVAGPGAGAPLAGPGTGRTHSEVLASRGARPLTGAKSAGS
jgi:hypothetical protein